MKFRELFEARGYDYEGPAFYENRRDFINAFNKQGFEKYNGPRGTRKWKIVSSNEDEIKEYGAQGGCGYKVLEDFIDNYAQKNKDDIKEIIKVKNATKKFTIVFNDGSKITLL